MISPRAELHQLIDRLPSEKFPAAIQALRHLEASPPPSSLEDGLANAPIDDKPHTDADCAAMVEGLDDLAAGRVVTNAEIRRELGLR